VDLAWSAGKLKEATILPSETGPCQVVYGGYSGTLQMRAGEKHVFSFE